MAKKILICDDDADLRSILRRLMPPACEVLEAADGEEALRLIAERGTDLVLLDLTLPGMSGLETLAAYRDANPRIVTLVLTGNREISVARKALALGAREFITKPFEPGDVRAAVLDALEEPGPARADARPWRVKGDQGTP